MEHGLKYVAFYVQKHTTALAMCYNPPLVRVKPLDRICEIRLIIPRSREWHCVKVLKLMVYQAWKNPGIFPTSPEESKKRLECDILKHCFITWLPHLPECCRKFCQMKNDSAWCFNILYELPKISCKRYTVKPVYNDHLMGHFSAFWSASRAT